MAKDPAFLFYSSDFITGVSDLTMEERGQYITLLCLQHQKGRLSRKIINIATPNVSDDVLSKFKQDKNALFFNKRLEIESDKRRKHSEKQRQRAIDGWKKRKATANATALPLVNENEIILDNILLKKVEKEKLILKHGKKGFDWIINKLSNYKLSSGKKYKSDYGAINSWVVKEWLKENKKGSGTSNMVF